MRFRPGRFGANFRFERRTPFAVRSRPGTIADGMPKGLLVDFGGVLTTSVLESFAAFARGEGIEPKALAETMRWVTDQPDNLFQRVERGAIDTAEFEVSFAAVLAERTGVAVAPKGLKSRLFALAGSDERMLGALAAARRGGVRTGLVSNSWGVTDGGYPVDRFGVLFDAVVISGEVGLRKPEPAIYLLAAERIGCEPRECVFVDDFAVNVDGARATGMEAVHHRDAATTIPQLERLLGVPLDGRVA